MAVTFTVSTAAAAAAAIGAGALGLGALAGAALAGRGGGRRGGGRRGGFRGGRGRGRFGRRFRGRRDVQDNMVSSGDKAFEKKEALQDSKKPLSPKEQFALEEEHLLAAIAESDTSGCSFRLVCELAGQDPEALSADEAEVLRYVSEGHVTPEGHGLLPDSPVLQRYQAVGWLGENGYDCHSFFPACQSTASQLMGYFRTLGVQ